MAATDRLPDWARSQARPFPDANLLLLPGPRPALVDTGFVGNATRTRDWAEAHAGGRRTGRQHPLALRPRGRQRRAAGHRCGHRRDTPLSHRGHWTNPGRTPGRNPGHPPRPEPKEPHPR